MYLSFESSVVDLVSLRISFGEHTRVQLTTVCRRYKITQPGWWWYEYHPLLEGGRVAAARRHTHDNGLQRYGNQQQL